MRGAMGTKVTCPGCEMMCTVHSRPNDRVRRELDIICRRTHIRAQTGRSSV